MCLYRFRIHARIAKVEHDLVELLMVAVNAVLVGADGVLAVKDNQPKLAESIEDFWRGLRAHPAVHTPHSFCEDVEKGHGRIETSRCYVFD